MAEAEEVTYGQVLGQLSPGLAIEIPKVMFSPIDLLFYGIAVYEGYRFSFRRISEQELAALAAGGGQSA